MIYTLAVFLPWVAFSLRGGIFSTIFSFILWVVLCLPMIVAIVATFMPDLREYLGFLLAYGFALQIDWFFGSFLLWVVLTTWCCLVMHGDQRRKEMEQLINTIETNSVNLYTTKHNKQMNIMIRNNLLVKPLKQILMKLIQLAFLFVWLFSF